MKAAKDILIGYSTMNWFVRYEYPLEVRQVPISEMTGYESNYVRCWNYCRDRGWDKIGNFWVSPDRKLKYKTVYEAYNSQKFKEMVEQKV